MSISAIVVAVAVIALPALNGPLVHDSTKLYGLETLFQKYAGSTVWHTPSFGDGIPGRIVAMASFVINVQLAGEVSGFRIKATNVCLHVLLGLMLFFLARALARIDRQHGRANLLALIATAMWLLAPVNLSTSFYAIQRMAQLSALFSVLGLLAYVAHRRGPATPARTWIWIPGLLLALLLATASKENGLLMIPFALLIEGIFFRFRGWRNVPARLWVAALILSVACVLPVLMLAWNALDYSGREFTLAERLLTQPRIIFLYLREILLPFGNDPGVVYPVEFSTGLLTPWTTLASLFGVSLILAFAVYLWCKGQNLSAFGLAFFFIAHAMESTILPLEMAYLHRNYLASFGIFLAIASAGLEFGHNRKRVFQRAAAIGFAGLLGLFISTSWVKSMAWSSMERYRAASFQHHPDSRRVVVDYSAMLADQGRGKEALEVLDEKTQTHFPRDFIAHVARIFLKCRNGQAIDALDYERLANAESWGAENEISQALYNLEAVYKQGCNDLDPIELSSSLAGFAARQAQARGTSWHVDYFVAGFLDAAGNADAADAFLLEKFDASEPRAGLFLADRLVQRGENARARKLLLRFPGKVGSKQFARYRAQYDELLNRATNL